MQVNNASVSSPARKTRTMGRARFGSLHLFCYTHYEFVRQIYVAFAATFATTHPVVAQRVRKPVWKQHLPVPESSFSDVSASIFLGSRPR